MAHNLLGQRFYQNRTAPAWHGLGINDPTDHTAEEALRRVGMFDVVKTPLFTEDPEGNQISTPYYSLLREPIKEDPTWRVLGSPVTSDYEVITPLTAARLWDDNIRTSDGQPVAIETLGILGKGERMFISTRLPAFDVRGDEIQTYLLYDNPLENGDSIGVYTTPVRTVCQNTLTAGIARSVEQRRIPHYKGATKQLAEWLKDIYAAALMNVEVLAEAHNVLAKKKVTKPAIKWIVENVYPLPTKPQPDDPAARSAYENRLTMFEYETDRITRVRSTVLDLADGKGVGMDTPATKGTAFGAWNAVAEFETYRRGSADSVARNLISGNRAARIRNAFTLAMHADHYKTADVAALELMTVPG